MTGAAMAVGAMPVMKAASARVVSCGASKDISAKSHRDICQQDTEHTLMQHLRCEFEIQEGEEQHEHQQILDHESKNVQLREAWPQAR